MVINGNSYEKLKDIPRNSVDSLVTDPPAGIAFMGNEWDEDKGSRNLWISDTSAIFKQCLRVLKPGAHGLVWAFPRTSHWTATALELAGFEVRDVVTHIFGTGFPKSLDISKAIDKAAGASTKAAKKWQGWGTTLKPASEHWILVRKPLDKDTVASNVLRHGTGGINIDASRIGSANLGRFPSNLVLDEVAAAMLDEQSGKLTSGKPAGIKTSSGYGGGFGNGIEVTGFGDTGGASRFFYVAKASKSDKGDDNTHPTPKNTKLMEYLIKLVTPKGGTVLDPFMGSGSTGVAAKNFGFKFIGIEKEKEYFEIAKRRLEFKERDKVFR